MMISKDNIIKVPFQQGLSRLSVFAWQAILWPWSQAAQLELQLWYGKDDYETQLQLWCGEDDY